MVFQPRISKFLQKIAEYCGFSGCYLPFIKVFNTTMDGKRAFLDSFTSSALFYLVAKFVCVWITHRTPALNPRTLAHKPQTSARACICLSLFFLGGLR